MAPQPRGDDEDRQTERGGVDGAGRRGGVDTEETARGHQQREERNGALIAGPVPFQEPVSGHQIAGDRQV